ncbi:DUF397 domain-containing protein [Streptomyces oceani]
MAERAVHVRDSKARSGPVLSVTREAWGRFLGPAADRLT